MRELQVYRNKRSDCFEDDTSIEQSKDMRKMDPCLEIPGLSSFNIWMPWKNKQEAYMAIDEFLRDVKQQVLERLKYNSKIDKELDGEIEESEDEK